MMERIVVSFPKYTVAREQAKKDMNKFVRNEMSEKLELSSLYGKFATSENLNHYYEQAIKELLEENAKYKAKILSVIERDLALLGKYNMPEVKLGLQHAKTLILMEGM